MVFKPTANVLHNNYHTQLFTHWLATINSPPWRWERLLNLLSGLPLQNLLFSRDETIFSTSSTLWSAAGNPKRSLQCSLLTNLLPTHRVHVSQETVSICCTQVERWSNLQFANCQQRRWWWHVWLHQRQAPVIWQCSAIGQPAVQRSHVRYCRWRKCRQWKLN